MFRLDVTALLALLGAWLPADAGAAAPPEAPPAPGLTAAAGLSESEAVLRALQSNPNLRAFRKQRGIAEAQIVSATALVNPLLQLTLVHLQEGPQLGWTATLKWTPPQPVELAARRSQARATLDEVRYAIAEQEWTLAAAVRLTHATILELREQARILTEALALRRRMGGLVRTRVQHGGATRLELNLIELAVLNAQRDLDDVELRRTQAQSQLQALLGVVSAEPVEVSGALLEEPAGAVLLDAEALAEQSVASRPLRKAAHARVIEREQALRLAKTRLWPWPELNARFGQTGSSKYPNDWQAGFTLPLPVLNQNAGPIQVAAAEFDKEHAAEQAQIETLKQGVYAACAELKLRHKILRRFRSEVLPVLSEHDHLMEIAVRSGQLDLSALLSSEESVLRGQRDYSAARLAFRQAWLMLEAAVGASVGEVVR